MKHVLFLLSTLSFAVIAKPTFKPSPFHFSAKSDRPFTQSLTGLLKETGSGDLVWSLLDPVPEWLSLDLATQELKGTPTGASTFQFRLSVKEKETDLGDIALVKFETVQLPKWKSNPVDLGIQLENAVYEYSLLNEIDNPSNLILHFEAVGLPPWMSMSSIGKLTGTPRWENVGAYSGITFKAILDDGDSFPVMAKGVVKTTNRPPEFAEGALNFRLDSGTTLSLNINSPQYVADPEGDAMTFEVLNLPPWITFSSGGDLNLRPLAAQAGDHSFEIQAKDFKGAVGKGQLKIHVRQVQTETIQVDTAVNGAATDVLWVVAHNEASRTLIHFLNREMANYFDTLASKKVHASQVYLAANSYWFGAKPNLGNPSSKTIIPLRQIPEACSEWSDIVAGPKAPVMKWDQADLVADFKDRTWAGWNLTGDYMDSPVFTLNCFYEKVRDLPEPYTIYQKDFLMSAVPTEIVILTNQTENFPWWASETPKADYKIEDYAKEFLAFYKKEKKAVRFHVLRVKKDNGDPHRTLAQMTGGKYMTPQGVSEIQKALRDVATTISQRAHVHAKNRIPLSAKPFDPKKISLKIAGKELPGNTDQESDLWRYDGGKNEVEIDWYRINETQYPAGSKIEIQYAVTD